jgi:hypothetical protein
LLILTLEHPEADPEADADREPVEDTLAVLDALLYGLFEDVLLPKSERVGVPVLLYRLDGDVLPE